MPGPTRPPQRAPWTVALDAASLLVFAALMGAVAWRLEWREAPVGWPALAAGAALGWLAADVATGCVHWFCDTFFRDETPLLGSLVIRPFREHHRDPLAITRHGFLERNGNNALIGVPAAAGLLALTGPAAEEPAAAVLLAFGLAVTLAGVATNQIHCWAHAPRVPRAVVWLQRCRLILPPAHHARHHGPAHRGAYCVTSGWMDPLLDGARVFEGLERGVRSLRRAAGVRALR